MKGFLALIALGWLSVPMSAAASEPTPYALPASAVHSIHSARLNRDYKLVVLLPPSYAYAPDRRYPVLFFTDMPQSIALIRGMQQRMRASERGLEDAILVGLSYAAGETALQSRRRDYTPTPHGDLDARSDMPGRSVEYGEAEQYRQFLKEEAFPFLEAEYRIDPARRIYLGHSYGGLFGTHVLLTEPEMFQRYILISPSLWYGRRLMIARERGYATRHKDLNAKVLMMIGAKETVPEPDTEPYGNSRFAMVEDMAEMEAMLKSRNYPSLSVQSHVFEGENHGSVYIPAVRMGLKWALPGKGAAGDTTED